MEDQQAKQGRIMTYDTASGKGLYSAHGERAPFSLDNWKSDVLPAPGMLIQLAAHADGSVILTPVSDADRIKRTFEEVGGKLSTDGVSSAKAIAGKVVGTLGIPVVAAYALYIIGVLGLTFATVKMMGSSSGINLYDLIAKLSEATGSSFSKWLLWLSVISPAIPVFWKNGKSYLAYTIPLASFALSIYTIYSAVEETRKQMASLVGPANMPKFSDVVTFGAGFYLTTATAFFLAFTAFVKLKAGSR